MQKYFSVPLFFLVIAAAIGLLLRYHFISPFSWLTYPYWLHAHSHVMFLGWVFNVLYLAFLYSFFKTTWKRRYTVLFWCIQFLVIGMMVAFPLQGYAAISIAFSTLHIIAVGIFCIWFFKDTKTIMHSASRCWFRMSLVFFLISSLGPFTLGPLVSNGLGHSDWYYFSIYYYLHFQYNGVFIFGVIGLFLKVLEDNNFSFDKRKAQRFGTLLCVSIFPAYILSTLWASPGLVFNVVGAIAALLQLIALIYFVQLLPSVHKLKSFFSTTTLWLWKAALFCLILKSFLQLLSAHPIIAQLAFHNRSYVIAYLHLVLIGIITFFLIGWYEVNKFIPYNPKWSVLLLITGFVGTEFCLISAAHITFVAQHQAFLLFSFSVMIFVTFAIIMLSSYIKHEFRSSLNTHDKFQQP